MQEHAKLGIVLVNLGTPTEATAKQVRNFLKPFLSDPRVVEMPAWLWKPILHGVVLRHRPTVVARKYASIFIDDESPLLYHSRRQAFALQKLLPQTAVRFAFRYGTPSLHEVLDELTSHGISKMVMLPLYPQYASSTTGSVAEYCSQWMAQQRRLPDVRFMGAYFDHPAYIEALAHSIKRHWQNHKPGQRLLLSYHGLPRKSLEDGDPYYFQCHATARALQKALNFPPEKMLVSFQSRFGALPWLQPYTQQTVEQLAREGIRHIDVACPSFSVDCLETLEEICVEVKNAFLAQGGEAFNYIPCLNDNEAWITALTALLEIPHDAPQIMPLAYLHA